METKQTEVILQGLEALKKIVEELPERTVISLKVEEVMECAKEERK